MSGYVYCAHAACLAIIVGEPGDLCDDCQRDSGDPNEDFCDGCDHD